jgi:hypothetical protein
MVPGASSVSGNRLLAGGLPGIAINPAVGLPSPAGAEPYDLPAAAGVAAEIWNNEIRDHDRIPTGVGIRIDAIGVFAPDVHGTIRASIHDNLLVNNRFALIFHGGFPNPDTQLRGDVDVTLRGNVMKQSCQANLLVGFSRHKTILGLDDPGDACLRWHVSRRSLAVLPHRQRQHHHGVHRQDQQWLENVPQPGPLEQDPP